MKNSKVNTFVKISMLVAIAYLLETFLEFPIPGFPPFLKLDFSDLPAVIGGFALGPAAGIIIELMKNLIHGFTASSSAFVGELANFLIGSTFVLVSSVIYRFNKTKKTAVISLIIATIVMSAAAGFMNYYVLLPLYVKAMGMGAIMGMCKQANSRINSFGTYIIWAIIPFNILKGALVSFITVPIYKSVSGFLHSEAGFKSKKAEEKTI